MSDEKNNTLELPGIIKSEVKATVNGEWKTIGYVDSTYLIVDGKPIINPNTGMPYIVPVGYNPQDTINRFINSDKADSVFQDLYKYKTGGDFDLQRSS